MTHEAGVSSSCGESVRAGKIVLVSALELVSFEISTPDTPGERVRVEMAELVSAPELRTSAGVVSDPVLNVDVVVLEIVMLVSVPVWVSKEAFISRTSVETSGVVMVTPVVLVLAVLPGVLRRVNFPTMGVETLAVIIAVLVVSALSVPLAGSPVNWG